MSADGGHGTPALCIYLDVSAYARAELASQGGLPCSVRPLTG